jgi:hypothetical protein
LTGSGHESYLESDQGDGLVANANFPNRGRLEQAVARLEAALESQGRKSGESDAALACTLSAAETENAQLKTLNQAVSARLDVAIGRLKTILEG